MRVLSLFHHNHSFLALFGWFFQEMQAKTAQKVQVNYGYGETKRESVAGNSNREKFFELWRPYIVLFFPHFRAKRKLCTYQFVTKENKASMLIRVRIFGDETKKSFLGFVVRTIRYSMKWVLVQNFFTLRFLDSDTADRNGQFGFWGLSISWTRFWLFELLIEFQFLKCLLHHFDSFWLIDFDITKKLEITKEDTR